MAFIKKDILDRLDTINVCVMHFFTAHSKEDSDLTWAGRKLTQQIINENQTSSTPRAGE